MPETLLGYTKLKVAKIAKVAAPLPVSVIPAQLHSLRGWGVWWDGVGLCVEWLWDARGWGGLNERFCDLKGSPVWASTLTPFSNIQGIDWGLVTCHCGGTGVKGQVRCQCDSLW